MVEKDIHTFENQTDEVVEFIVFRYLPSYKNHRELLKNDKEMIEEAGLGVAMGNSTPVIKEVANVEVGTNNEEGVRETFQKYSSPG